MIRILTVLMVVSHFFSCSKQNENQSLGLNQSTENHQAVLGLKRFDELYHSLQSVTKTEASKKSKDLYYRSRHKLSQLGQFNSMTPVMTLTVTNLVGMICHDVKVKLEKHPTSGSREFQQINFSDSSPLKSHHLRLFIHELSERYWKRPLDQEEEKLMTQELGALKTSHEQFMTGCIATLGSIEFLTL